MEIKFFADQRALYVPWYVNEWHGVDYYSLIDSNQPKNVCLDCNHEFGYWKCIGPGLDKAPINLMNSNENWHYGECEVCGKENNLTDPKYYGYLYKGWQDKKNEKN